MSETKSKIPLPVAPEAGVDSQSSLVADQSHLAAAVSPRIPEDNSATTPTVPPLLIKADPVPVPVPVPDSDPPATAGSAAAGDAPVEPTPSEIPAPADAVAKIASPTVDPKAAATTVAAAAEVGQNIPAPAEITAALRMTSQKKEAEKRAAARLRRRAVAERVSAANLSPPDKQAVIARMKRHDTDVGSSEIQIGIMSARINHLTEHLKIHPKDKHTMRGLVHLVNKRRKLLKFIGRTKPTTYMSLLTELSLRK